MAEHEQVFQDALTGSLVEFVTLHGQVAFTRGEMTEVAPRSLFFPGCSYINYASPLIGAVYDTLAQHGEVDGISFLCCGKILSYEPNGAILRDEYEDELRKHVKARGIERFVCACPNCVKALREAFALDADLSHVKIEVLPAVLSRLGYQLDPQIVNDLCGTPSSRNALLCTHDSCPDREYGDFAEGLRSVMPEGMWVEPKHCRSRSVCCGSLPRAQGKDVQADKCADICGSEASEKDADAIVTACMSCTFQLNMAQGYLPAIHFLEFLYNWRIDWAQVGSYMKLRFLFDEVLGAIEKQPSGRAFAGLPSDLTIEDKNVIQQGEASPADGDVAFSNIDTLNIGS